MYTVHIVYAISRDWFVLCRAALIITIKYCWEHLNGWINHENCLKINTCRNLPNSWCRRGKIKIDVSHLHQDYRVWNPLRSEQLWNSLGLTDMNLSVYYRVGMHCKCILKEIWLHHQPTHRTVGSFALLWYDCSELRNLFISVWRM